MRFRVDKSIEPHAKDLPQRLDVDASISNWESIESPERPV